MRLVAYAHGLTCHSRIGMEFLRTKPLGGTEHVLICWIEEMRKKGHDVSLIMDSADTENVPYYFTRQEYLEKHNDGADVMICVNYVPEDLPLYKATKRVWWGHQPGFLNAETYMKEFDTAVVVSPHQRSVLSPRWQGRMEVIGYGFDPTDFPVQYYDNRTKLIYHSTPGRGLDKLVEWLPDLIAIEPEIQLVLCSDWSIYYPGEQTFSRSGKSFEIPEDPHIVHVGAVGFYELLYWLNSSYIHAFPSTYPDETFCYAVLFSQAAGLPVVTSRAGALQDTASDQILIDWSDWGTKAYKSRFLGAIDRLLHDEDCWQHYHVAALQKAQEFTWAKIIPQWEDLLESL